MFATQQTKVSKSQLSLFSDINKVMFTPQHTTLRTYPEEQEFISDLRPSLKYEG
jgi:hypothetical protein